MKKILTILASCVAITCARGAGIVSGTISAGGSGAGGSATNVSGGTFNNVTLNSSTVLGKVTATSGNTLTNSPVVELYQGNIAHITKDSSSYWTSFPSSTTAGMNEIQSLFPGDPTNGTYAGFHVKIASGRYQFSSQIVISNSCIIEGTGPASTIFEYVGNTNFATVNQLTNILTAEPFAINAGRVSLIWATTNAQKVLGEDGVNYNVVIKNLSVVTKTNMFCVGLTVSGGDSSIIDNVWVGGPQVFDSYNGFSGWVSYNDIPEPSKMIGMVLGANQPKIKDSRVLGVACGLIIQGNSLSSLENFNAINCGVDVNQDGSSVFPLSSQLSLNAGVMMPLTTQCENLNIDRLLTYGCWVPIYIGAQPPVRISGWFDQSPNLNQYTIGVLTNCAAHVEIVGGVVVNSLAVVKTNSNFTTDNTQNVTVTQWLSGNGQIESWNGYSFGSVVAGSFNGGTFTGTFTGNGSGLTNLPLSGIQSQSGVGYFYDANNNLVRTNSAGTITQIQTPSGSILYSNAVNAGIISGASSVQLPLGMPNNPIWFGTNANMVISSTFSNDTNGWSASYACLITNTAGNTITFPASWYVQTNGVSCASHVATFIGSGFLDGGGSKVNGIKTNFYGIFQ